MIKRGVKVVKVVIVGLGIQGKKYARLIYGKEISNLELVGVVARSEESQNWAKENLDGVKIFDCLDLLMESDLEYDGGIITTYHKSHPEIAIRFFEKNKAVLCDKPSGIDVEEVKKMNEKGKNLPFCMMFNNRVQPIYKFLKDTVDKGEIGEIKRILFESTKNLRTKKYHNSASWRSTWDGEGGGALINQGQHLLDIWCWVFGMPKEIVANVCYGKYNEFEVEDEASILFKYEDKSGVFIMSTGEGMGSDKIEVVGSCGRIEIDGNKCKLYKFENVMDYIKNSDANNGVNLKGDFVELDFENNDRAYHIMLENFGDVVEKRAEPIAKGEEGLYPLEICKEVYKFK